MRLTIILAVVLLLALTASAWAQVKCAKPDGSAVWASTCDQVPGSTAKTPPLPSIAGSSTADDCTEAGQRTFREDAESANRIAGYQAETARMRGEVETDAQFEARLAARRRKALDPLKHELECLEKNHAEAVRKLK